MWNFNELKCKIKQPDIFTSYINMGMQIYTFLENNLMLCCLAVAA